MKIEISRVESAFAGMSFGNVGPYEKVVGRAFGEVDPSHALNAEIVNLGKAPRNAAGRVEYWVDFCLLKPTNILKSNRHLLFDALNRGDKLVLVDLNDAPKGPGSNELATAEDAGNGFLMRQGYPILFGAWQGDVVAEEGHMLARFPIATDNGAPIAEKSREEYVFGTAGSTVIAPLTYPANTLEQSAATLTVRQHEKDPRMPIPARQWRYLSPTRLEITLAEGFDAGAIYEFIYPARDPIVMGLGFAAVRELVTFMRSASADENGRPNPLSQAGGGPAVDDVIAYGRSQPGRFLREFLRLGFNQERSGRRVFDGVYASLAGSRRIFLNQPFSQPGRFNRRHEDHLYPGDQFPFTYTTRFDPISAKTDGILTRCLATDTCPKIMHVDSSTEFWQGRGSLVVTDESGKDITLPDQVRVYALAGTGHAGPAMFRHSAVFFQNHSYPLNRLDYGCLNRALLVALQEWVSRGTPPPASRFPRASAGTLVPPSPETGLAFPDIPGMHYTGLVNGLCELDYRQQPPRPIAGHDYPVLVPKVDADGNEIAGIRLPDVTVPLGTRTGWNIRSAGFAEGALMAVGFYIPFAATAKERRKTGDPRLSLEERYPSHEHYVKAVARAATELQNERLLLAEDVERYLAAAVASQVGR
ncbi:MAG TPA: alpha/beta hydrolase domain-containing protein [Candidatus Binataceae bacterium]|nr:alpha/beta hydrolase domain-containing protein [Candidatus Binataceae bacterium]